MFERHLSVRPGCVRRPSWHRLLILAPALLAQLMAQPVQGQTARVRGMVRSAVDGAPVATAEVRVRDAAGGERTTFTNLRGAFAVIDVAPGPAVVEVAHAGFATLRVEHVVVTTNGDAALEIILDPVGGDAIVVSASRSPESRVAAPGVTTTVDAKAIEARPAPSPVEHLRAVAGVDIITTGLQSANVTTRGFNNIFSGSLHMLSDYRIAGVPSLRVNLLHFIPAPSPDVERIEVVLGPGSALYGPNTANGVLHLITKSPLTSPGTTVALATGERGLFQGEMRTAHRISDRFGVKISGQYMRANEWETNDPVEVATRASAIAAGDADTHIGLRDFGIERWSVDGRADLLLGDDGRLVFAAGRMNSGSGIELTSVGAAQAVDWASSYAQLRLHDGRFFAQAYVNTSDAGDTYLLREGTPLVDQSRLYVAQIQHGATLAGVDVTGGIDYRHTDPRTGGTINGANEDEDNIDEVGAFLGARLPLGRRMELLGVGRVDHHSELADPVVSPRLGVVVRPAAGHAFRLTWNRAFSTPSTPDLFLDIAAGPAPDPTLAALGYRVRAQGTGRDGFRFRVAGSTDLRIRSPFNPGGGAEPLAGNSTTLLHLAAGALAAKGVIDDATAALLRSLNPTDEQVGVLLLDLTRPTAAPVPQESVTLDDAPGVRPTINSTIEAGYNGQLTRNIIVSAGAWYSRIDDFTSPPTLEAGYLALLNGPALAGYLTEQLVAAGVGPAQAQQQATQLAGAIAQIPLGVVTSPDMKAQGAELLATFRNYGRVELHGFDVALDGTFGRWGVGLAASAVSDDHFVTDGRFLALNAPKLKTSLGIRYVPPGLRVEGRVRHVAGYPASSAVYSGKSCVTGSPADGDCVAAATQFDVNASWQVPALPGVRLQASIQNLLDDRHTSFPGAPEVGRLGMMRLVYSF